MLRFINQNINHVTIFFGPKRVSCAFFIEHRAGYSLHAWHQCTNIIPEVQIPSLATAQTYLTDFIKQHYISGAHIHLILAEPYLIDRLLFLDTSTPNAAHIPIPQIEHMTWFYRYLYTTLEHKACMHLTAIKRELLCGWQLRMLSSKQLLASITSYYACLLNLYFYLAGRDFRHTQLGLDLANINHNLEQLVTASSFPFLTIECPFNDTIALLYPHVGVLSLSQ